MSLTLPRFHIPLPRGYNFTDERIGVIHLISFLNDIERITALNYEPSDDDVIRARLLTLRVREDSFCIEQGTLADRSYLSGVRWLFPNHLVGQVHLPFKTYPG